MHGKQDLNNTGPASLQQYLLQKDPLHLGTDAAQKYSATGAEDRRLPQQAAGRDFQLSRRSEGVVPPEVVSALQQDFYTSNFVVRNVEIVGPQVGRQLRHQALMATLYSLPGMLVYLWFRFEMIYGVGAVVACLHDTIITVGFFSLLNKEISLTVIAAILTLIGYSMNDTIVVFDRIRENIKLMRREPLAEIVNKSINQTLSRTILHLGIDLPDGAFAIYFRRRGAARLLAGTGDRHPDRHLFVDRDCRSHAGLVPGMACQEEWAGGGSAAAARHGTSHGRR